MRDTIRIFVFFPNFPVLFCGIWTIRLKRSSPFFDKIRRCFEEYADLSIVVERVGGEVFTADITVLRVYEGRFGMHDWFFGSSCIYASSSELGNSLGIGTDFLGIGHTDGDGNFLSHFRGEDIYDNRIIKGLGIEENVFLGTSEESLNLRSTVDRWDNEIGCTLHYLLTREIRRENLPESLSIGWISSNHVHLAIVRETRITQIPGCDDVGVVYEEEFGMDEIIEVGVIVCHCHSRSGQRLERFGINGRSSEDIFFEENSHIDTPFLGILKGFYNPFLGEDIDLDRDAGFRRINHRDDAVEDFFVRGHEDLDFSVRYLLDGKILPREFRLCLLEGESLLSVMKSPVFIPARNEEKWENKGKEDFFRDHIDFRGWLSGLWDLDAT